MLYAEGKRWKLYGGDCLDVLAAGLIPGDAALITDPPYGIGYKHGARKGGRLLGTDGMDVAGDDKPFDPAHLVAHPGIRVLWGANHYADKLPASSCWLVWDKRCGVAPNDQADCELAWTSGAGVARLMSRYWNGAQRAGEMSEQRFHPTQKPVGLMEWCFGAAGVPEGALVVDPYTGSGTTGVAALRTGRCFVGVELMPHHLATAARRLAQAESDGVQTNLFGAA